MQTMFQRQEYQLELQTSRGGGSLAIAMLVALLLLGIAVTLLMLPPFSELAPTPYLAAIIGILVLAMAAKASRIMGYRRRAARLARRYPHAPWWQDYPWDPLGIDAGLDRRLRSGWFRVVIAGAILVPIHYGLLREVGAITFVVLAAADLFLLVSVLRVARDHRAYRRYGRLRLAFERFPFAPGEQLALSVILPRPFGFRVTLRFVEEKYWKPPHPRQPPRPAAFALYTETIDIDPPDGSTRVPLHFDLPDNLDWVTRLTARPNVQYWELHLESTQPGVDLEVDFPLPVYQGADRARSSVAPVI